MGLFSGIKDAKVSRGGVYLEPGVYTARVEACKSGVTRKGAGFFVVEMTVLESNNPKFTKGSSVSWMVVLDKEPSLGNIKHFAAIATNTPEDEIDEAGIELIVSAENPLRGTILEISATNIKTKAGGDFTKVVFTGAHEPGVGELRA